MPTTTYRDYTITYTDDDELRTLIEEIWRKRTYYVEIETPEPYIIDAGAHIGLPVLYLHTLYPRAKFLCFEPNPTNLKNLRQNLEDNLVDNVTIIPKALSDQEGTAKFFTNERWSVFSSLSAGGWTGEEQGKMIAVETTPLLPYLDKHVDLLKMDIEGSETMVLEAAQEGLVNVDHLILEFHRTHDHHEERLLKILRKYFDTIDVTIDHRKERNYHNQLLMIEASRGN